MHKSNSVVNKNPLLKSNNNSDLYFKYKDPSFQKKFTGNILQKDYYKMLLYKNHYNISKNKKPKITPFKKFSKKKRGEANKLVISSQYLDLNEIKNSNFFEKVMAGKIERNIFNNPYLIKYGENNFGNTNGSTLYRNFSLPKIQTAEIGGSIFNIRKYS